MAQLDNITVAYLVLELSALLENSYVNKVSEISGGVLKLKLHTKQGSKDLIIANAVPYISDYSIPARHGKTTLASVLAKELYNKKIVSVRQHFPDRIIEIKFFEHSLILELLGEGNMVLTSKDGTIIACAKNEKWAGREIKKGLKYSAPPISGLNPQEIAPLQLSGVFANSQKDAIRALIGAAVISPPIAEEIFYALGKNKNAPANKLTAKETEDICRKVNEFYTVQREKFSPVAYADFTYPFRLNHVKQEPRALESLSSFLNETISNSISSQAPKAREAAVKSGRRASGLEHHQALQEAARKKFMGQIDGNRKAAELIYENYTQIEELLAAMRQAISKGLGEKEIMAAFSAAASKGNRTAALVKKVDLKTKIIELELSEAEK